ncbi:hypothetical protein E2C01_070870 [Portunus trituberculatus]|uniref:Uncharacterized protein n=1 Tax=Portunus trituberculatus TaxID=210409 RepID=A0A5B7I4S2_PORTR|nr:hypothetical protein [Portunus trituberculatus]
MKTIQSKINKKKRGILPVCSVFPQQHKNATKTHCLSKKLKYIKNGLFWCIPAFYVTTLRIADKTHYLSKEVKYVKNGIFWCIPAFYATKLRFAGKTHYLYKVLWPALNILHYHHLLRLLSRLPPLRLPFHVTVS